MASAELYDPRTGRFTPTGSMETARGFHTATLLADGRVLVSGAIPPLGRRARSSPRPSLRPKDRQVQPDGLDGCRAQYHTATLIADGRVLITGGTGDASSLASAEMFDPKTGKFSPTGQMADGRVYQTATLLPDGRVLVAGGATAGITRQCRFLASAAIYDPKTGTFSATRAMSEARLPHRHIARRWTRPRGRRVWARRRVRLLRPRSTTRRPARSARPARVADRRAPSSAVLQDSMRERCR